MGMTSCMKHPEKNPLIVIRAWQVDMCEGDHCAATLLSFFEYFHNIKCEMIKKNKRTNDLREANGDGRVHDESLLQFHTLEELSNRILNLYSKTAISNGIKLLERLKIISIHRNPNPKYSFDKTRYYQLHPSVCNRWVEERFYSPIKNDGSTPLIEEEHDVLDDEIMFDQPEITDQGSKMDIDEAKMVNRNIKTEIDALEIGDRYPKTAHREDENNHSSTENRRTITSDKHTVITTDDINYKNNKIYPSVNQCNEKRLEEDRRLNVLNQSVIQLFCENGFPRNRVTRPQDLSAIQTCVKRGITLNDFKEALEKAYLCKREEPFSLYYVLKIIETNSQTNQRFKISEQQQQAKGKKEREAQERREEIKERGNRRLRFLDKQAKEKMEIPEHMKNLNRDELIDLTKQILKKGALHTSSKIPENL